MSATAAFFDFDGTLIDGYSAKAVLTDRVRRGAVGAGDLTRLVSALVRTAAGEEVLEDYLRAEVAALKGVPMTELDKLGQRLTRGVIGAWLHPEVMGLLAHHRKRGDRLVIATSALPFQVEPLAAELGVDEVLCTRIGVLDGACTGEVEGEILWGDGKARAVQDYARRTGIDLECSHAYGNGAEDVAFLSSVGHPVAVNPDGGLAEVAAERGWRVERFTPRPGGGVREVVRTTAAYGGLAAGLAVGAALGVLNGSRRDAANIMYSVGSDVGLSLAGVHLQVAGRRHLWEHRPAVFVFNHQSMLDGWVAINLLRQDFTGLAKKEIGRVPVLGQFAWLANIALIDRADSGQARAALEPVLERLREGYSITLAPEGTRSVTPAVGPFKKGAFHLAMQAGVPVVPIVIRNAGELQARSSHLIRAGRLDVAVLPPISVADWTLDDLDARVAGVRQQFVDALDDWEGMVARLEA
jgi:putative phosphoserine phosphatase/1-acylglycerol-3-phosphate O-acyltransferase